MTWYFDAGERSIDVYDHNGDLVAEGVPFDGSWSGGFPREVFTVMRENMDRGQPSYYNQQLLMDAATENIEEGQPPGYFAEAKPATTDMSTTTDTENEDENENENENKTE